MATSTTNYSLVKPADNESADIVVINNNMDTIDTKIKEAIDKADSAFQSANSGKTDIATVVGSPTATSDTFMQIKDKIQTIKNTMATNLSTKGVAAIASETLSALASKIANILKGQGNATEPQVLNGATFTNVDGVLRTGTMPSKVDSVTVITPTGTDQVIPKGYFGGVAADGKVAAVVVPVAKVLNDTAIAGQQGTMPDRSGAIITPSAPTNGNAQATYYEYDSPVGVAGYVDANTKLSQHLTNLIVANLKSGVSIPELGLAGTLVPLNGEKKWATGTVTIANAKAVVSGLNFTPKFVIAYLTNPTTSDRFAMSVGIDPLEANFKNGTSDSFLAGVYSRLDFDLNWTSSYMWNLEIVGGSFKIIINVTGIARWYAFE